ncbi:unnamed protein product [Rotaria sp. Silwood1]|nr:unnamed protein product [Rotaria sp. Silwood1]CAF1667368.1 unnamed protein product [Rotaria sp. Silwood1]CAF3557093.1 unnamed protein product [Rotaria sp. Silwood1]CAF3600877.1 unnamed protein product [Rotaria sp. Silwood1]CAF3949024.1 unnamed protein product [Rotaria sp. Silwood1]
MSEKTLHTAISIDPELVKLVSNQATKLIEQIQIDIKNDKQISHRTYETCNAVLSDAHKAYIRTQIAFFEETKILIEQALDKPDVRYHETWLQVFEIYIAQCKRISGPILQVLNSVAIESDRLKHKYRNFVTGAVACSAVSTVLVIGLVLHFLPASICCFTLTAGGVALATVGTLLAAGLGIACIIGAMEVSAIRAIYDKCTSEIKLLVAKCMPCLFNAEKNVVTGEELHQAIKNALNEFKIKEANWTNIETLKMLKRSIDRELDALKQN